jgi:hypothetical protein
VTGRLINQPTRETNDKLARWLAYYDYLFRPPTADELEACMMRGPVQTVKVPSFVELQEELEQRTREVTVQHEQETSDEVSYCLYSGHPVNLCGCY